MHSAVLLPVLREADKVKDKSTDKDKTQTKAESDRECIKEIMRQEGQLMSEDEVRIKFYELRPGGGSRDALYKAWRRRWKELIENGHVVFDEDVGGYGLALGRTSKTDK